ncbi:MAG: hypothetical protein UY48_C0013G0029 [Candidatus Gottesmanbacteria bacterium GW2011_GWB1_49_7]|uniref:Uncharacterized protein n=1 Tax=Candidatus Gottesmanbacteria bacterium GW2011_GWB1_49_7 TaxID=1618448 RepID=A0A0G1VZ48_9BACT|nr:MAG: hypothetical protein UY48_C0013G0029 [Candidatus Gottesmanbacteria bacterium GW2011_GWB1_49_7]
MAHCPFCGIDHLIFDANSSDTYLRHLQEHEKNGDIEIRLQGRSK